MSEVQEGIIQLKKERDAIILAHNYQPPDIQNLADFVGDSLELAIQAKNAKNKTIVLCGVMFMAETAKLLNPDRTVLIPSEDAGCPLASYLTPNIIQQARDMHPGAPVVVYINSTAACKAAADITCTSGNAVLIVSSLPEDTILFGPDANLADYVQHQLSGKTIIPIPPDGHCYVHTGFTIADVTRAKERGGSIICHPECRAEVQELSDYIASTGGMTKMTRNGGPWHIFTERDMVSRLCLLYPEQVYYQTEKAICTDMKKITPEKLLFSLKHNTYQVTIPPDYFSPARDAIEKMLACGR
jgi:quinolinate synthase